MLCKSSENLQRRVIGKYLIEMHVPIHDVIMRIFDTAVRGRSQGIMYKYIMVHLFKRVVYTISYKHRCGEVMLCRILFNEDLKKCLINRISNKCLHISCRNWG